MRLVLTTKHVSELHRVATASGINSSELLRRLLDGWIGAAAKPLNEAPGRRFARKPEGYQSPGGDDFASGGWVSTWVGRFSGHSSGEAVSPLTQRREPRWMMAF